ncbi:unnamed protein product [Echinostoma caproni]|uniref:Protein kinase domain-containing protein n=1 Tax=Echinostoma caproni TaxID=27848 RepID=A0A183ARF3_9TREM|nr:unnamed protein product [Echinostoma caproni]
MKPNLFCFLSVLEYVPCGTLSDLPQDSKFDDETAKRLGGDLISGVHYLHQINIIHRDLNPNNLLLTNSGDLKITDFSLSVQGGNNGDALLTGTVGTSAYLAPECVSESSRPYYGKIYFNRPNKHQTYQAIREENIELEGKSLSPNVIELLQRMLQKDPTKRCRISEISEKLITN